MCPIPPWTRVLLFLLIDHLDNYIDHLATRGAVRNILALHFGWLDNTNCYVSPILSCNEHERISHCMQVTSPVVTICDFKFVISQES